MARHQLIDAYLASLARRLPTDTIDELTDGLIETWQHHVFLGRSPEAAAQAAIAEFGAADRIADEFVAQAPGRHTARLLLATGPVMAICWGTSLITAKVWTWPLQRPIAIAYGLVLLTVVLALLTAATSRHSYRRTRLATAGALALTGLDITMIAAVVTLAPQLVWPMVIAIPASLVRIGLTLHALPRPLTS
jgi:hypothetical protein